MYPWKGKNIYFIGFMATGKSKVGREFSRLLGWPFDDTDVLIEEMTGKSIPDIFSREGEAAFRALENRVVSEIAQKTHRIVSLGGGAVISDQSWQLVQNSGVSVCLYAETDVLIDRIVKKSHRPLVENYSEQELRSRILTLLRQRQKRYQEADFCFESRDDVSAKNLAQHIFEKLLEEL